MILLVFVVLNWRNSYGILGLPLIMRSFGFLRFLVSPKFLRWFLRRRRKLSRSAGRSSANRNNRRDHPEGENQLFYSDKICHLPGHHPVFRAWHHDEVLGRHEETAEEEDDQEEEEEEGRMGAIGNPVFKNIFNKIMKKDFKNIIKKIFQNIFRKIFQNIFKESLRKSFRKSCRKSSRKFGDFQKVVHEEGCRQPLSAKGLGASLAEDSLSEVYVWAGQSSAATCPCPKQGLLRGSFRRAATNIQHLEHSLDGFPS